MSKLSPETIEFINKHRKDDVRQLALQSKKDGKVDINEAVTQIAGWQIAEKKIPSWSKIDSIIYPKHLSMEQCSSEITARFKASLVKGETFADLTSGFGVDCSFIASGFKHAHYVERQEELCDIARHNFKILGLNHIEVHNTDGIEFLKNMEPVDCIYLDPARRNSNGVKTVAITDCEPDVSSMEELLVEKGSTVMIKLSPMLDLHSAMKTLKHINSIYIISVNNECKELVIILSKHSFSDEKAVDNLKISCEQLVNNSEIQHLEFTYEEEKSAEINYSDNIGEYLYEPGAAILKAGAFKILAKKFCVNKLHQNSQLYTSDELIDFPGRRFKVIEVSTFAKKNLKAFLKDLEKANLTIRNFPSTVDDLRKKLKLKEGGDVYIFATTLANGDKVLIKCQSLKSFVS
ncbi:SAM-dependent methyltransferase [uncultured Bacteroides sp.]|uniref:class I SAM-dependent methyltransferase n=1 Tax=uncultured Bacteroides sp. TaxID=162156 RepID=UPI002612CB44|nr:SAM-dependent methyltransferase [uncultured Bacteroides sp.]